MTRSASAEISAGQKARRHSFTDSLMMHDLLEKHSLTGRHGNAERRRDRRLLLLCGAFSLCVFLPMTPAFYSSEIRVAVANRSHIPS
jgi:hypothetical protein